MQLGNRAVANHLVLVQTSADDRRFRSPVVDDAAANTFCWKMSPLFITWRSERSHADRIHISPSFTVDAYCTLKLLGVVLPTSKLCINPMLPKYAQHFTSSSTTTLIHIKCHYSCWNTSICIKSWKRNITVFFARNSTTFKSPRAKWLGQKSAEDGKFGLPVLANARARMPRVGHWQLPPQPEFRNSSKRKFS